MGGLLLEETVAVVDHVGLFHHHGDDHLGRVLHLLVLVVLGIVLGEECSGIASGHLEDIDSDTSGNGAAWYLGRRCPTAGIR